MEEVRPVAAESSTPAVRDSVDDHVDRWLPLMPGLDRDTEGAVTRMAKILSHLNRVKERSLADSGLARHEFDTLFTLAGRQGLATPKELAGDLNLAPASVTGRLDALEQRGYVRRVPSADDRRRVAVHLTEQGRAAWRGALDVQGHEEDRVFGVLAAPERRVLSDLLRHVLSAAERTPAR
ncbi:MarR family winged helix-turn-helix transcriptional regulator [Streptomyces sp. NPDC007088]|uniref:MarR family winged helix-turn-helix transcriptional regulator n=1 Tax=Streptomyces sp. NPDC007088 TaxID=3364773 RepID=UPI0036B007FA